MYLIKMKTKLLIIFAIAIIGFAVIVPANTVYGMWFPQSPEELFEQSETVFVGIVTSVNVLEFERSSTYHITENGVSRIEIKNYTQTLDEYTVDIEEFLKNPQESNTITMLEATVSGVPGRSVSIGGFELSDRVLFYVPKIDGTNQYSPESFKIPEQCDAKSVLEQPKITLSNDFKIMQDGIVLNDNFTANKPIQYVYNKDMRTLEGRSFDVDIIISKIIDKNNKQIVIQENIHAESKPCEWIATASWEIVPTVGRYSMWMQTSEGNSTGVTISSGGFNVIEDISLPTQSIIPLQGDLPLCTSDRVACQNPPICENTMWDCPDNSNIFSIITEPEPPTISDEQRQMMQDYCETGIRHPDMIGIIQCIKESEPNCGPNTFLKDGVCQVIDGGCEPDINGNTFWCGVPDESDQVGFYGLVEIYAIILSPVLIVGIILAFIILRKRK